MSHEVGGTCLGTSEVSVDVDDVHVEVEIHVGKAFEGSGKRRATSSPGLFRVLRVWMVLRMDGRGETLCSKQIKVGMDVSCLVTLV